MKVVGQLGVESAQPIVKPTAKNDRRENCVSTQKILVIDDEPSHLEMAALYFEETEFELITANSVAEGKARLHSHSDIRIVITDLRMPGEDGFAMLKFLRENLRFNHIPVVVSTSCKDYGVVMRAAEEGAFDYLLKPFEKDVLLHRVRKVVEQCQKTVLLVSDNRSTVMVLNRALTAEGFRVESADCGAEAFTLLTNRHIDVVVSELALEDMTGMDLLAKAQDVRAGFPFLFIEDSALRITNANVVAAGARGLLKKPFNNVEVARAVQRVRFQQGRVGPTE